jgi:hypothetical protein
MARMVSVDEIYAKHAFHLTTIAITSGLSAVMHCANFRSIDLLNKEVYNRTLSADEAASVEKYLRNKFGTQ